MKISIVPSDGIVYLDGTGYYVEDAKKLANRFHAIQWDGTEGHVEYVQPKGEFFPNETIYTMEAFQNIVKQAMEQMQNVPVAAEIPLPMYAYKRRQQIAFSQARTQDFGVQYSDPVSVGMITALVALFDKGLLTGKINYKGPNGFISLDKDEMLQLAAQVAAHIQKAFNAEKGILEQIEMGTITKVEQIDTAYKDAMTV